MTTSPENLTLDLQSLTDDAAHFYIDPKVLQAREVEADEDEAVEQFSFAVSRNIWEAAGRPSRARLWIEKVD